MGDNNFDTLCLHLSTKSIFTNFLDQRKVACRALAIAAKKFVPFKLSKMKLLENCYIENNYLEKHNAYVFKGEVYTKEGKKAHMIHMLGSFSEFYRVMECKRIFGLFGLVHYFIFPPWGVDTLHSI